MFSLFVDGLESFLKYYGQVTLATLQTKYPYSNTDISTGKMLRQLHHGTALGWL
jgi:hypothetical protein